MYALLEILSKTVIFFSLQLLRTADRYSCSIGDASIDIINVIIFVFNILLSLFI